MHVSRSIRYEQNVLIIQPYIKWGPRKSTVKPDVKLREAEALIKSLDTWSIQKSMKVGLLTLHEVSFFGRGKIAEIVEMLQEHAKTGNRVGAT